MLISALWRIQEHQAANTRDYIFRFCTLIIQQHILWFEVSVDDPLLVEVLHALDDLSSVVAGPRFIQPWVVLIHVINVIPNGIREGV